MMFGHQLLSGAALSWAANHWHQAGRLVMLLDNYVSNMLVTLITAQYILQEEFSGKAGTPLYIAQHRTAARHASSLYLSQPNITYKLHPSPEQLSRARDRRCTAIILMKDSTPSLVMNVSWWPISNTRQLSQAVQQSFMFQMILVCLPAAPCIACNPL